MTEQRKGSPLSEVFRKAMATHDNNMPVVFIAALDERGGRGISDQLLRWIDVLIDAKVKISMDGKGAWRDNRMVERLWRSLKYECIYLQAFERGSEAKAGLRKWLTYYNAERPYSTHGILTPDEAYASKTEPIRLAA